MKATTKTGLIALLLIVANGLTVAAQTKVDIFSTDKKITWLGLDFTLTKFIGAAEAKIMGIGKKGDIPPDQFRDEYTVGWNRFYVTEPKKYDVAGMLHRGSVEYAIDVAKNSNSKSKFDKLYTDNPSDFKLVDEAKINSTVKSYDFAGHDGVGLVFFISGMYKGMDKAGIWVTFVDMKSKTVLLTKYYEGKPGGFGLKNYWAKAILNVMKDVESDFNSWK